MTFLNNKKYSIIWTTNFKSELKNIFNYLIYFPNFPLAAEKLHKKIVTSLSTLQYFPERHTKIRETKNFKYKNIHRLIIDNYIIYEVNSNTRSSFYSTYISFKSRLFNSFIMFFILIKILLFIKDVFFIQKFNY